MSSLRTNFFSLNNYQCQSLALVRQGFFDNLFLT
nr:MAG TPA: hypothetical protein [Caudoviricetes sp.]DAT18826.1 MAG TPA: hypothetical protein [Bacteriophage sp.]DAX68447.1 MAG TPA: hypothetical protein [Bacteriophage sp.]